jgi:hypothetical protein
MASVLNILIFNLHYFHKSSYIIVVSDLSSDIKSISHSLYRKGKTEVCTFAAEYVSGLSAISPVNTPGSSNHSTNAKPSTGVIQPSGLPGLK